MALRAKITLPLLISSLLLASYLYAIWLPRLLADAENSYLSSIDRHLDSVAEGLVPLLLGGQLDAVYGNLDALLKMNESWEAIELHDPHGRLLYPLDGPLVSKSRTPPDVKTVKQSVRYLDTNLGDLAVRVNSAERLGVIRREHLAFVYVFVGVLFLLFMTTGFALDLMVRRPIKHLVQASQLLAAGDFEMPLPRAGNDEIGTLLKSFVAMRDAIKSNTHTLSDTNEQLSLEIKERKRAEQEIRTFNTALERKVEERTRQLIEAQEELVRKEKLYLIGELSSSVGHELRNPLGVISNAVYFLKTIQPEADATVKEYLDIIKSETNNAERIITDLLDFFRVKTPLVQPIAVDELIKRVCGRCTSRDGVTLQLDLPDTSPLVNVDPLHMEQVFRNLITNGIQAMPGGGVLTIVTKVDREAGAIRISISDTGEGIAPGNMKKLFLPLFTTKARGIGLGLAIAKNLVEANGGRIEMESRVGKGTTFTVMLPVRKE